MKTAVFTVFLSILMTLAQSSCSWASEYTIYRGSHYSWPKKMGIHRGNHLKFKAVFDSSAEYNLGNLDQLDVNKLYGASDCGDMHMENSARFGWRWANGKIEILAFTHVRGKFDFQLLGETEPGKAEDYEIGLSDDKSSYLFKFKGTTVSMNRGCQDPSFKGYKLQPYFGGNQEAPHDIRIRIEEGGEYANFSLDKVYPNPVKDQKIFIDLEVGEDLNIGFRIYDLNGRLVQEIDPLEYSGEQSYRGIPIQLNPFAASMYLIEPYALDQGKEKRGFVGTSSNAMKLIVL